MKFFLEDTDPRRFGVTLKSHMFFILSKCSTSVVERQTSLRDFDVLLS